MVKNLHWSVKQISVLLTVIALLLWSCSILYARFEIGYFGLIHGLPITFFIALAFLTAASAILWTSAEGHGKLLCLQLLILISALWLVPQITGGSPPFLNHTGRSLDLIDYIGNQGHFSSIEVFYLSWPGAYILSTTLAKVLPVNFESMLGFYPLFMQLLYLLPLYVFLKNTLGKSHSNYCWAGAWLFYTANWTGHEYFSSAPSVGLFLFLLLLALVTMPSTWEKGTKGFALSLLVVSVFAALVITHLLTALAAMFIMVALSLLNLLKRKKETALVAALCLLVLVSWSLTGAAGATKSAISSFSVVLPGETIEVPESETIEVPESETVEMPAKPILEPPGRAIFLSPGAIAEGQILVNLSGSESHIAVVKVRILFSAMFAMIGIIGAVVACLTKRRRNVAIFILAIAVAPLILLVLSYAGRVLDHLYLFSLAPMAYFGARLLNVRRGRIVLVAFCLFLVASFPLHVIAHYGNQAYDYWPQSGASGTTFSRQRTNYPIIATYQLQWQDHLVSPEGGFKDSPCYLYIHRQEEAFYDFICGDPLFMGKIKAALSDSSNCNLIYYNPDFKLYFLEPF